MLCPDCNKVELKNGTKCRSCQMKLARSKIKPTEKNETPYQKILSKLDELIDNKPTEKKIDMTDDEFGWVCKSCGTELSVKAFIKNNKLDFKIVSVIKGTKVSVDQSSKELLEENTSLLKRVKELEAALAERDKDIDRLMNPPVIKEVVIEPPVDVQEVDDLKLEF